jgi:hypothetical protein
MMKILFKATPLLASFLALGWSQTGAIAQDPSNVPGPCWMRDASGQLINLSNLCVNNSSPNDGGTTPPVGDSTPETDRSILETLPTEAEAEAGEAAPGTQPPSTVIRVPPDGQLIREDGTVVPGNGGSSAESGSLLIIPGGRGMPGSSTTTPSSPAGSAEEPRIQLEVPR